MTNSKRPRSGRSSRQMVDDDGDDGPPLPPVRRASDSPLQSFNTSRLPGHLTSGTYYKPSNQSRHRAERDYAQQSHPQRQSCNVASAQSRYHHQAIHSKRSPTRDRDNEKQQTSKTMYRPTVAASAERRQHQRPPQSRHQAERDYAQKNNPLRQSSNAASGQSRNHQAIESQRSPTRHRDNDKQQTSKTMHRPTVAASAERRQHQRPVHGTYSPPTSYAREMSNFIDSKIRQKQASRRQESGNEAPDLELGMRQATVASTEDAVGAFAIRGDTVHHRRTTNAQHEFSSLDDEPSLLAGTITETDNPSLVTESTENHIAVAAQIADSQVQEEVRRVLADGGGRQTDADIHAQLDAHVRRILAENAVEAEVIQPMDTESTQEIDNHSVHAPDTHDDPKGEKELPAWYCIKSFILIVVAIVIIAVAVGVAVPLATKETSKSSETSNDPSTPTSTLPPSRNPVTSPPTEPPTLPLNQTAVPTTLPPTTSPTSEPTVAAEWEQLGPGIDGLAANGAFGLSLSLARKATIVAGGAPQSNGNTGYVSVHRYNSSTGAWTQRGQILSGEFGSFFGWSVSLSDSGDVLAVGDDYVDAGFVRLYQFNETSNSWIQKGIDLLGLENGDHFGSTVELSGDGSTVAAAATGTSSGYVGVYRFNDSEDKWTQLGDFLKTSTADNFLGFALSLSKNGNILVVGSHENSTQGTGEVVVYQLETSSNSWTPVGQKLTGDAPLDRFGVSVSLSSNGRILAAGAPSKSPSLSYVRVYELVSGEWQQVGSELRSVLPNEEFGKAVSLSGDAKRLAVGSRFHGFNGFNSGLTQVFEYDGTSASWSQLGQNMYGEKGGDESGFSVSLSATGNLVAVSSHFSDVPSNGNDSGQVRMFQLYE